MTILTFGEKLKELREKSGLTQRQLAAQIGIGKSTLAMYESKDRMPSPAMLIKISAVFHVSTDYLLGIDKRETIDVTGLSTEDIGHLEGIVSSLKRKNNG